MKLELTKEEKQKIDEWWQHHKCNGRYSGAIGGIITYKITPTGLGDVFKVKCGFPDCGEELDLTNWEDW